MNKNLFSTKGANVPTTNTRNAAGGIAYKTSDQHALAQYACTGTFNNTFYASAKFQVDELAKLAAKCSPEYIARVAIYARQHGMMKDAPAYLVAHLTTRKDPASFRLAFGHVINNVGMVRNFVQIMRSGAVGRKSLGSSAKKAVQRFLVNMSPDRLFWQAIGTNPSVKDVLCLTHPRPNTTQQVALFAYLRGKDYNFADLPQKVQDFENYKKGDTKVLPDVGFQRLTALNLNGDDWKKIVRNMTWNQLRLNLNTAARHGVFDDAEMVKYVCKTLRDEKRIRGSRALPFALYSGTQYVDNKVPQAVKNALQDALEIALANAPVFEGGVVVLVDTSGSMSQPVTGRRPGATSKTSCKQAASVFAAAILKANPDDCVIVPFDVKVHMDKFNPRDSLATITNTIARRGGGGTDIGCGIKYLNDKGISAKTVIIVSDNESWVNGSQMQNQSYWGRNRTGAMDQWAAYARKNKGAKLISWDFVPNTSTQTPDSKAIMNVGGFSDAVFKIIDHFANKESMNWVQVINDMTID